MESIGEGASVLGAQNRPIGTRPIEGSLGDDGSVNHESGTRKSGSGTSGSPSQPHWLESWARLARTLAREQHWFRPRFAHGGEMVVLAFCAALGACTYLGLDAEPARRTLLVAAAVLCASAIAMRCLGAGPGVTFITTAVAVFAIGAAWCQLRAHHLVAPLAPVDGAAITVQGWIEGIDPPSRRRGVRVVLRVSSVDGPNAPDGRFHRVRFSVASSQLGAEPLALGAWIQARVWLTAPPGPATPGAYDFARNAHFQRLGGVGRALAPLQRPDGPHRPGSAHDQRRHMSAAGTIQRHVASLRGRLSTQLFRAACTGGWVMDLAFSQGAPALAQVCLPERGAPQLRSDAGQPVFMPRAAGGLVAAVVTGDRSWLPTRTTSALPASGLGHMVAISGLHMALVAGGCFFALSTGLAAVPMLARRCDVRQIAAVGALVIAAGYLVLSGASVSTQRAFVMAAAMFVALLARRHPVSLRVVGIAALVVLALAPESAASPGFHMSFAATIALIAAHAVWRRQGGAQRPSTADAANPGTHQDGVARARAIASGTVSANAASIVAGTATAPFAAYHFHRLASFGLIGNVLALPVFSLWVMPLAIAAGMVALVGLAFGVTGLAWLHNGLAFLAGMGAWLVAGIASAIAGWPASVGIVPAASPLVCALAGASIVALSSLVTGRVVVAGACVLAGVLIWVYPSQPDIWLGPDGQLIVFQWRGSHHVRSQTPAHASGADVRPTPSLSDAAPTGPLMFPRRRSGYRTSVVMRRAGFDPGTADRLDDVWTCDRLGCQGSVRGKTVALALSSEALADDCQRADMVILLGPSDADSHPGPMCQTWSSGARLIPTTGPLPQTESTGPGIRLSKRPMRGTPVIRPHAHSAQTLRLGGHHWHVRHSQTALSTTVARPWSRHGLYAPVEGATELP